LEGSISRSGHRDQGLRYRGRGSLKPLVGHLFLGAQAARLPPERPPGFGRLVVVHVGSAKGGISPSVVRDCIRFAAFETCGL
jgi:hypothetical protein